MSRFGNVLCFFAVVTLALTAQTEPTLVSLTMPKYPPLARQARVEGVVTVKFALAANSGGPTNVEIISGHPLLKDWTLQNVKTWRFENPCTTDRTYETTFNYRLSEFKPRKQPSESVTFESFRDVEVRIDALDPIIIN